MQNFYEKQKEGNHLNIEIDDNEKNKEESKKRGRLAFPILELTEAVGEGGRGWGSGQWFCFCDGEMHSTTSITNSLSNKIFIFVVNFKQDLLFTKFLDWDHPKVEQHKNKNKNKNVWAFNGEGNDGFTSTQHCWEMKWDDE